MDCSLVVQCTLCYEYCRMLIKQLIVYTVYTVYSMTPVCGWNLNLLHVNDIHVRMEETNKYSAGCRIEDKELTFTIKILFKIRF